MKQEESNHPFGACIEDAYVSALVLWRLEKRPRIGMEEALANDSTGATIHVAVESGQRAWVTTTIHGRRPQWTHTVHDLILKDNDDGYTRYPVQ